MINLFFLGAAEVHRDGVEGPLVMQPKRLALLATVACSPRPVARDQLLAMLWPEVDDERARGALSQALHYLRRSLGADVLVSVGDQALRIDPARCVVDVRQCEAALDAQDVDRALTLYRGDFLPAFHVSEAPEFERFVDATRERLRRRLLAAILATVDPTRVTSRQPAIARARRGLEIDPGDEAIARSLMRLLQAEGDSAGAVRVFDSLARALADELAIEPSAATRDVLSEVRAAGAVLDAIVPSPTVTSDRDVVEPPAASPAVAMPIADTAGPTLPGTSARESRPRRATWRAAWALGLVMAAVVVAAARLWRSAPSPSSGEPARIAVVPFDNRTGDSTLGPLGVMAADWIIHQLARIDGVQVVPMSVVVGATREREAFVGDTAVSAATGASIIVRGSVYRQGDTLLLQASATDASRARVLVAPAPVRAPARDRVAAVDAIARQLLTALAPHADARMAAYASQMAPPPTFEAYTDYARGLSRFTDGEWREALAGFRDAAARDTTWKVPVVMAAISASNLGDMALLDSLVVALAAASSALPPYERVAFESLRAWRVGDHAAAFEAARRASTMAPGSIAHAQMGKEALALNRPQEAARILGALDPERGELRGFFPYWDNYALALHLLGDAERERRAAARAVSLHPARAQAEWLRVRAVLPRTPPGTVADEAIARLVRPGVPALTAARLLVALAQEARVHDRPVDADSLAARAIGLARPLVDSLPAERQGPLLDLLLRAGYIDEAAELAERIARARGADELVWFARGLAAADRGATRSAQAADSALARAIETRRFHFGRLHVWRARIAARQRDPRAVLAHLQAAVRAGYAMDALHAEPDLLLVRDDPTLRQWLAAPR